MLTSVSDSFVTSVRCLNHSVHHLQLHHSGHLVDLQLLLVVQLGVPLVQGSVPGSALTALIQLQHSRNLEIRMTTPEILNVLDLDLDTIRLDQLGEDLGPDVPKQVLNVLPDESVLHDGLLVHL